MKNLSDKNASNLFLKSIESIASSKSDTYKYFSNAYHYITMVAKGYSNSLILKSPGGLGKSYTVLQTLKKLGVPFVYHNSYSTPLSLYMFLYNNRNGKIIVLDDCENVLKDNVSISIIKSALWSPTDKRIVSYLSTSEKLTVNPNMIFNSRIIFCVNTNLVNNETSKALQSRVLYYEMRFSYKDIIKIMNAIARESYKDTTERERMEVVKYLQHITDEATMDLNFRTLIKSFDIYIYSKKYKVNWKDLINGIVKKDEILSIVKTLMKSDMSIRHQASRFKEITGMSRATYWRKRKSLNDS